MKNKTLGYYFLITALEYILAIHRDITSYFCLVIKTIK